MRVFIERVGSEGLSSDQMLLVPQQRAQHPWQHVWHISCVCLHGSICVQGVEIMTLADVKSKYERDLTRICDALRIPYETAVLAMRQFNW
jgi:hypothetical protein